MSPELKARTERMLNAGTSEGSRKGWETRRGRTETKSGITQLAERSRQYPEGKKASEASYGAMISSRTADEHDENEQYNKENAEEAARAHDQASAAHTAAALAAVRRGDTELAQFHKFRAGSHLTKHLGYLSNGKTPQVTVQNAPKANVGQKLGNTGTSEGATKGWETRHGNPYEHLQEQRQALTRIASNLETQSNPQSNSSNHNNLQQARRDLTDISAQLSSNPMPDASVAGAHVDAARNLIFSTDISQKPHEAAKKALEFVDAARQHIFNVHPPRLGNSATDPEPFSATMFGNSMNVRKQRADAARKAGKEEAAETPEKEKKEEEEKLVNDGEAVAAAGASPAVPSRLASLSSSPMLKKEAVVNAKEVLRDELRNVASKHNGYLPNSRHVTQKEIDMAKRHLPVAKPGLLKNGAKKVVRIQNGICRGKKVEFTFNELRDFARNGKVIANWTPPSHIEESGFKP